MVESEKLISVELGSSPTRCRTYTLYKDKRVHYFSDGRGEWQKDTSEWKHVSDLSEDIKQKILEAIVAKHEQEARQLLEIPEVSQ